LELEAKIISDKFCDIQDSYQKTIDKLIEENSSLNKVFKQNMEKYLLQDKKNHRVNHLIKKIEIKKSINDKENVNNNIMEKLNDSNKKLKNIIKAFMTCKIPTKDESIKDIKNKIHQNQQNLLKEKLELFGVIKNIVNNPENKDLIDENIYHAIDYLEDSLFPEIKEIKDKEKQKHSLDIDIDFINNNSNENIQDNYHSPSFLKDNRSNNINHNSNLNQINKNEANNNNKQINKIFENEIPNLNLNSKKDSLNNSNNNNNSELIFINDINYISGVNANSNSNSNFIPGTNRTLSSMGTNRDSNLNTNTTNKNLDGDKNQAYGKRRINKY
jgi:hypothetical protein